MEVAHVTTTQSVVPSCTSKAPKCKNSQEKGRITITCEYAGATLPNEQAVPPVELNRAFLSFETREESYMVAELVFTSRSKDRISDVGQVYLEIDDDSGNNYMRRLLSAVDFRKLAAGAPSKFSARLLSAAFIPKDYIIYLWIPSSEPSLKFRAPNNFLISSGGVPDSATGLNRIAEFTVEAATPVAPAPH